MIQLEYQKKNKIWNDPSEEASNHCDKVFHINVLNKINDLSEDVGDMAWSGIAMDVWLMKYKLLGFTKD